ncbi:tetratricopeptide repeat protein [Geomonas terrae]|uniref:Tetratricopeptide repeat protein n=1 Tax=Geomonas terrae TaxID=2562681 RepID=A0A4S1CN02_9BACT|nr:tetratricopeptide repeat protein [Geomonas terrae]TGU75215.1 tetratricopeptide repeat protein [Geomonas terrae]
MRTYLTFAALAALAAGLLVTAPCSGAEPESKEDADFRASMERVAVQSLVRKGAWEELYARSVTALGAHPDDPVFLRGKIRALRELGYGTAARGTLQKARAAHPDDTGLLEEELWLIVASGDWQKLLRETEQPAARPDADADLLMLRALALRETGNSEGGIALFTRILKTEPENCVALTNRGRLLAKLGKKDEALTDLTAAIKTAAGHAEPLVARGRLLCAMGRYAEAEKDLTAGLALDPVNVAALLSRSEARFAAGNVSGARSDVEVARKIAPKDQRVGTMTCRVAQASGDVTALAGCAEELTRLTPKDPAAWRALGRVRLESGDFDGALVCYDTLVQLTQGEAKSRLERATVRLLRSDYAGAEGDCTAVIEQQPVPLAYALRSMAHLRSGALPQAEEDSTNALALDRNEPNALLVRANLALGRNDLQRAAADCERAIRRAPNSPWAAVTCGKIQLQAGELDQAASYAERAKKLAPADFETRELIAAVAAARSAGAPAKAGGKAVSESTVPGKGEKR